MLMKAKIKKLFERKKSFGVNFKVKSTDLEEQGWDVGREINDNRWPAVVNIGFEVESGEIVVDYVESINNGRVVSVADHVAFDQDRKIKGFFDCLEVNEGLILEVY